MTGALIKAAVRSCDEAHFCLQPLLASMEELVGQVDLRQAGEEVHACSSRTHNVTIQLYYCILEYTTSYYNTSLDDILST